MAANVQNHHFKPYERGPDSTRSVRRMSSDAKNVKSLDQLEEETDKDSLVKKRHPMPFLSLGLFRLSALVIILSSLVAMKGVQSTLATLYLPNCISSFCNTIIPRMLVETWNTSRPQNIGLVVQTSIQRLVNDTISTISAAPEPFVIIDYNDVEDSKERLAQQGMIQQTEVQTCQRRDLSLDELVSMLNQRFQRNIDHILLWVYKHFPEGDVLQLSSFGPSGMVIIDRLHKLGILSNVTVVSIDTLHLFPETYQFISEVRKRYREMRLRIFRPAGFVRKEDFDSVYGSDLWKTDPDKYDYIAKVEPTERALREVNSSVRITGRRNGQGGIRSSLGIFSVDNLDPHALKVDPLAHWSYDEVWSYIKENHVPYNPLHDRGYKSIGDVMTSIPVDTSAPERSGRFVELVGKTECGIHSVSRPREMCSPKRPAIEKLCKEMKFSFVNNVDSQCE